jgi:bifunctional non-homologous end joining protein LigD
MSNFYKPMLARTAEAPFNSRDWIFEMKWDGIRAISRVNSELSIRSRNNRELNQNFPELEELKNLAHNVVLDGEIVVMKEGKPDFQAILERSKAASPADIQIKSQIIPATYIVFDILEKDGKSLTDLPLIDRKNLLKESVPEGKHVVISVYIEEDGRNYYAAVLSRGLEGIMAKRKQSTYQPGIRSDSWLKIKQLKTCDCVIFGYTKGKGNRKDTFGALILGLYGKKKPVFVGKVGTGLSQNNLKSLFETFRKLETDEKTLEKVDVPETITWLKPELVCEVAFQTITRDMRLRMPSFHTLRTDRKPEECTLDQLVPHTLQSYASRRDFEATSEPIPLMKEAAEGNNLVFVVQEHHSRRLHYDLRLERKGLLKSWAVPKGFPERTGEKRLAVQTEDHPLDYSSFEGTIPEGQYGAGTVAIWDKGTYGAKLWEENRIEFTLKGKKLKGKYFLTRFKKAGENEWILLKMREQNG